MTTLNSATGVRTIPIEEGDQASDLNPKEWYGWRLRGSASQSRNVNNIKRGDLPAEMIDSGVRSAAAIDALLRSVRFEIDEGLVESTDDQGMRPSDSSIAQAMEVARQLALSFHRQPWVDVVGFVTNDRRTAVLAHSMETGRRITFYTDGQQIRAIKAAVIGKPEWFEPQDVKEVRSALSWITRVD